MSETDIYKNRERAQMTSTVPYSKKRRRRSSNHNPSSETEGRRRRSRNSGLRRLLHLSRKTTNQSKFWWWVLGITVAMLLFIAVWQFWYLEYAARKQSRQAELNRPPQEQPQVDSAAE